jgi:hypothetical protein
MNWRPALSFYEKRTEILRCLDDKKVLRAFRLAADHIDARLTRPGQELRVRQSGLALELLGQDADADLAWPCVVAALERIEPENTTVNARYQHIIPLELPFKEAVAIARDRFIKLPSLPVSDLALVLNLEQGCMIEFGIVGPGEAIPRLTRTVGQMRPADVPHFAGFWEHSDIPDVALYADSLWPGLPAAGENYDGVREAWSQTRDRASEVVDSLYAEISVQA